AIIGAAVDQDRRAAITLHRGRHLPVPHAEARIHQRPGVFPLGAGVRGEVVETILHAALQQRALAALPARAVRIRPPGILDRCQAQRAGVQPAERAGGEVGEADERELHRAGLRLLVSSTASWMLWELIVPSCSSSWRRISRISL